MENREGAGDNHKLNVLADLCVSLQDLDNLYLLANASASLISSTKQKQDSPRANSSAQIVNPVAPGLSFTSQPNPPGEIAASLRRGLQRLNGSGRGGTCPTCKRTLINEHWRHLKDCGLRVCNRCFYRNERSEKKASKEAKTAGF